MLSSSPLPLARFASLPGAPSPMQLPRSRFAQFFLTPFRDVDERAARLAAASRVERDARQTAMSGAAEPRR